MPLMVKSARTQLAEWLAPPVAVPFIQSNRPAARMPARTSYLLPSPTNDGIRWNIERPRRYNGLTGRHVDLAISFGRDVANIFCQATVSLVVPSNLAP